MYRIPFVTIGFCALACGLMLLPPVVREALYFNYGHLVQGDVLGLISGHWIHADGEHLLWNTFALGVLAGMIEIRSRRLLLWTLVAGMVSVDLLLVSPFSDLTRYCGLSGLLNTLLGVALFLLWRETRSRIVVGVGIMSLAKIALELHSGQSVLTHISWPPYALAHLAGALGTPAALLLGRRGKAGPCCENRIEGARNGCLVASE